MDRETKRLKTVYEQYASDKSYQDLWHPLNPIAAYYMRVREDAFWWGIRRHYRDLAELTVLDVGCGTGGFLRRCIELGAKPANVKGVDLSPDRVAAAKKTNPLLDIVQGEADRLPFDDNSFDVVTQFVVLSSVVDPDLRRRIADEMFRVAKSGGKVVSYDMLTGGGQIVGIDKAEIVRLFGPEAEVQTCGLTMALVKRLAHRSWWLLDTLTAAPFLRSHALVVAGKTK